MEWIVVVVVMRVSFALLFCTFSFLEVVCDVGSNVVKTRVVNRRKLLYLSIEFDARFVVSLWTSLLIPNTTERTSFPNDLAPFERGTASRASCRYTIPLVGDLLDSSQRDLSCRCWVVHHILLKAEHMVTSWRCCGIIALWFATFIAEMFVYDSFIRNWKSARHNGYSAANIVLNIVSMILGAIWVPLLHVCYQGELAVPRIPDVSMVLRVMFALYAVDNAVVMPVHRFMHQHWPWIHHFHHTVFVSSFSSNLWLNFIDYYLEVGLQMLVNSLWLKTDVFGQFDPFAYTVFIGISFAYYILDHDRLLQLEHYRHHTHLDSNYYAYVQSKQKRDPSELLRHQLVNPEKGARVSDFLRAETTPNEG